jgi:hypothetical protein
MNKLASLLTVILVAFLAVSVQASDETDVRGTVQQVFQQLKTKDYNSLYEFLPESTRSRMSKQRFSDALRRSQDTYELDRMDVGTVRIAKDLAVVDTVLYGRVVRPIQAEGKIVVQQYLVKEGGKWRVATGDQSTTQRFLDSNPQFAKQFPIKQPRVYVKQDGNWVEFTPKRLPR